MILVYTHLILVVKMRAAIYFSSVTSVFLRFETTGQTVRQSSLRDKRPNKKFFQVRIQENMDQKNSMLEHLLHSAVIFMCFTS